MTKQHLTITQAGVTAAFVALIGQAAAFIPTIAQFQSILISAGGFTIAVAFLLANAIHHLASSKTPASPVNVRDEVNDVLRGIVQAGLQAQQPPPPPPPAAPSAVTPAPGAPA